MNTACSFEWLKTGDEAFAAMIAAIDAAKSSIRLESYIFSACKLGEDIRDALERAAERGVEVRVLVDAFGSLYLSDAFWENVRRRGGEVKWFNPITLERWGIRNHRKLLVCDENVAIVGGYNISAEYQGDGVTKGWRDLGLRVQGQISVDLTDSFEMMCSLADFKHRRFARLRRSVAGLSPIAGGGQVLNNGPGRGMDAFKLNLRRELKTAKSVQIAAAYFLPTWRIRRELMRRAREGVRVQILLAGKSDVALSQLAAHNLYAGMLRSGIEIHEYQPQVLHAKLVVLDDTVFIGSANLDLRSLGINYELMLHLRNRQLAQEAGEIFGEMLQQSRRINLEDWRRSRSFWQKLKERFAYFMVARVDPYVARRQMARLR